MEQPIAILFDIDGTLITTGGAGAVSWRLAFDELYGIPADIGMFSDAGMTDPEVGRRTFEAVLGHEPSPRELARVMAARLKHLPQAVDESEGYLVLDGVEELLPQLADEGYLLGLTTGGTDSAAHIKLRRGNLARWFTFGGYGSDSTNRTELTQKAIERGGMLLGIELDPARVLVVGDTPLDVAAAHGAGALAVNVSSSETLNAALRGFAEAGSDGIVQISTGGGEFASGGAVKDMALGAKALAAYARVVAERYRVLLVLHTDHCPPDKLDRYLRPLLRESLELRRRKQQPLFLSHMFDGSSLPLAQNLTIASELLQQCAKADIVLEVEAGVVGGEEDGVNTEDVASEKLYTTTDDVLAVAEALGTGERGRYLLAATFGNVHGVYRSEE